MRPANAYAPSSQTAQCAALIAPYGAETKPRAKTAMQAPPLHQAQPKPGPSKLDASPHMRVGKGARCSACARGQNRGRAVPTRCQSGNDFAHPTTLRPGLEWTPSLDCEHSTRAKSHWPKSKDR